MRPIVESGSGIFRLATYETKGNNAHGCPAQGHPGYLKASGLVFDVLVSFCSEIAFHPITLVRLLMLRGLLEWV